MSSFRKRFPRACGAAVLLGLFFLLTAAPGGGGGGGFSGGGGFGGGGDFGGTDFGTGGASSYAPSRPIRPDPDSYLFFGALLLTVGPLALWAFRANRLLPQTSNSDRYYLVHLALCLKHAERYVPELDRLLHSARFATPEARETLLRGIAAYIRSIDLQSAWLEVDETPRNQVTSERLAKAIWERQMERAGLDPALPVRRPAPRPDAPAQDERCVLGLLFDLTDVAGLAAGGLQPASQLLTQLSREPFTTGALYLYYAPDPGQRLDSAAALALLARLREPEPTATRG